ncbi:MAG TPA: hypothetical protein VER03_02385 [Bryobacteraceae bacterium]|nr:hypothetical protein [Bryobacteraceae bacterium]
MRGNLRRYERHPTEGGALISWITSSGETRFARTQCIDVSERGLRLECAEMIPIRTYVAVRPESESLKVPGQGCVRYCTLFRGKYHVGLEFMA